MQKSFIYGVITGILVLFTYNNPQVVGKVFSGAKTVVVGTFKVTGAILKGAFVANSQAVEPVEEFVQNTSYQAAKTTKKIVREVKQEVKEVSQEVVQKTQQLKREIPVSNSSPQIAQQKVPKTTISIVAE
jgi:hypothetical protein